MQIECQLSQKNSTHLDIFKLSRVFISEAKQNTDCVKWILQTDNNVLEYSDSDYSAPSNSIQSNLTQIIVPQV